MKEDTILKARLWGAVEFCEGTSLILGDQTFEADATKAYMRLKIAHAYTKGNRSVTAYGTAIHPGTLGNSYRSMLHQNLNYGHKIRSYDTSPERREIPRDYSLGSIVGVDYPTPPTLGWTIAVESDPHIDVVGVVHKQLEKVKEVFGEHLSGKHKWTGSIEMDYSFLQSGFMVGQTDKAKKKQTELMAEHTPADFQSMGLGYVPVENAPDSLLDSYSFNTRRVTKAWEGLPVVLLKGGINGKTHFKGIGVVRHGAEREAEIQQILASDPDRLEEIGEDGILAVQGYFSSIGDMAKRVGELFQ